MTASGGPDRALIGEARIWNALTGDPLSTWLPHGNDVVQVTDAVAYVRERFNPQLSLLG